MTIVGRLREAMMVLKPDMDMETLSIYAQDLVDKKVLQFVESESVAPKSIAYYVEDLNHTVLLMKASIDSHTGKGFTPPWGELTIYDWDGNKERTINIPQANRKIWG